VASGGIVELSDAIASGTGSTGNDEGRTGQRSQRHEPAMKLCGGSFVLKVVMASAIVAQLMTGNC
jgi:hypothetical protein